MAEQGASGARLHNHGRPVLIRDKEWVGENQPKRDRVRKGTFHVWGYHRQGGKNSPPSMQTMAIVELEDGRITQKLPDQITFLDRAGNPLPPETKAS